MAQLGHIGEMSCGKYLLQSFHVWNYDIPCALEKVVEVSEHISEFVNVITVFRDVNSVLHTITNINSA